MRHDPLKFRDGRRYSERLKDAKANTELDDAVLVAEGKLDGQDIVAAAQDFRFMAGSLGMAAGEGRHRRHAARGREEDAFILFAASGGARMQEGILSLMQMPRTTIAVQRLRDAHLPATVVPGSILVLLAAIAATIQTPRTGTRYVALLLFASADGSL